MKIILLSWILSNFGAFFYSSPSFGTGKALPVRVEDNIFDQNPGIHCPIVNSYPRRGVMSFQGPESLKQLVRSLDGVNLILREVDPHLELAFVEICSLEGEIILTVLSKSSPSLYWLDLESEELDFGPYE